MHVKPFIVIGKLNQLLPNVLTAVGNVLGTWLVRWHQRISDIFANAVCTRKQMSKT